jgi:hypothetical protein
VQRAFSSNSEMVPPNSHNQNGGNDADAEDVDESQHSTRCDSIGRAGTASDLYRRIP